MRERDIIPQLIDEIDAATASDVGVRTTGGDQDVDVPEVLVDWNATRMLNENGHNSKGGYATDGIGNKTGIEHHTYWSMEADCIARSYDESERDTVLHEIQSAFIPYEKDAEAFHRDTREWEIGNSGPRSNPVVEPDWYEAGVLLRFEYVKRVEETGKDTIQTIDTSVEADESLEDTSTQTN